MNIISPALKACTRPLHIEVWACNLSDTCAKALAAALHESRTITSFTLYYNPDISASGYSAIKAALAASPSPLTKGVRFVSTTHSDETLTKAQLVQAFGAASARPPTLPVSAPSAKPSALPLSPPSSVDVDTIAQLLVSLDIDPSDARTYAPRLVAEGFKSSARLAKIKKDNLTACGITAGFDVNAILDYAAGKPVPTPAVPATTPTTWCFLSYRQADSVAEVSLVAARLRDTYADRGPVFHDAEFHRNLSDLVSIVQHSKNALVFLSPSYFNSIYCLAELSAAVKYKVNVGLVYILKAGVPKDIDDKLRALVNEKAASEANIKSLLTSEQWGELSEMGFTVKDVHAALHHLKNLKYQSFTPGAAQKMKE